ncbi:LysR family transcriptional regulator [Larsenimonas suaedae]|uniref:LysR family transcriptional regulator n=1 Tax=Larsenimonas suaedae TaxID=1851019 RepID=A0ABU1GRU6_9GAMM|nr:LysR family transcriptional regulator [Larsenimonas suaedae]MCM2972469.1 LysR family transcriptional regulator [Larsenimonas suaedae]MDR5894735.1 LysR family transcriptional regulator [Larsenimonas suaedae]
MDRLNLNLLRTLAYVLEYRNVSQAARELGLTQSTLSRQLAQLRTHFNDPLLVRQGNAYLLTDRAQKIKPKLKTLLDQIEDLKHLETFDPTHCHRRFTFASTDYVANFIFPTLIAQMQTLAPGIDLQFKTWQPEFLHDLGSAPIDFAATMTHQVPDNLYGDYLGEDDSVILCRSGHPMADDALGDIDRFLQYPFVKITIGGDKDSFFDIELHRLHKKRRIAFEVPFYISAFEVVSKTDFLLVVPRHIALKACESLPLRCHDIPLARLPRHHYYLLWHSIHRHDNAHRWLRSRIAEHMYSSIYSPQGMA